MVEPEDTCRMHYIRSDDIGLEGAKDTRCEQGISKKLGTPVRAILKFTNLPLSRVLPREFSSLILALVPCRVKTYIEKMHRSKISILHILQCVLQLSFQLTAVCVFYEFYLLLINLLFFSTAP